MTDRREYVVPRGMPLSVFNSKYAREKPDGTLQSYAERVTEVVDGNFSLDPHWENLRQRRAVGPREVEGHSYVKRLDREHTRTLELAVAGVMPTSGRHLQHGDLRQPEKMLELHSNCATALFSFILFRLLLRGSGVGRDYSSATARVDWSFMPDVRLVLDEAHADYRAEVFRGALEPLRDARHKYDSESERVRWFRVEDTREGWSKTIEVLETAAFQQKHADKLFIFDFSDVRPFGTPIAGLQGRPASGPLALMNALARVASVKSAQMKPWKQALFIDHYLAECVHLGGARRAARIAVKSWRDRDVFEFIDIKRGGFLQSANDSIAVDAEFWAGARQRQHSHARRVFEAAINAAYFDDTGEPGFLNVDLLTQNDAGIEIIGSREIICSQTYVDLHPRTVDMVNNVVEHVKKLPNHYIVNPCFTGDTRVWTADGHRTFKELAESGADVRVLSQRDDGRLVYRWMRNPRVTRRQADIIEVTVKTKGTRHRSAVVQTFRCTPDHIFYVRNGRQLTEVQASELRPNYSLASVYRMKANQRAIALTNGIGGIAQHHVPFEDVVISNQLHVHHIDGDRTNDHPDNLQLKPGSLHNSEHLRGDLNPMRRFPEKNRFNLGFKNEQNGRYRHDVTTESIRELLDQGLSENEIAKQLRWAPKTVLKRLEAPANHRVVSVRRLTEREDVYCGTVDDTRKFFIALGENDGLLTHNCGEIVLSLWGGLCVIADVCLANAQSLDEAYDAARLTAMFLVRVNLMRSDYATEVQRTNRIGVSLTGVHEFVWRHFGLTFNQLLTMADEGHVDGNVRRFWKFIDRLRDTAIDGATEAAQRYSLPVPHTVTTIKPSGTISKVMNCTEGAHLPAMRHYLRWVQYRHDDPALTELALRGYPVKDVSHRYPEHSVVGFPTCLPLAEEMGDALLTADDVSPEDQYRWLMLLERYWLGGQGKNNQVSYTLKYRPAELTYEEFLQVVLDGQPHVRCAAVMPSSDWQKSEKIYGYVPEQPISADEYRELTSRIEVVDVERLGSTALDCEGGACPIENDLRTVA